MASRGNPNQWGHNQWPPADLLRQDIADGHSYVCLDGTRVVGTFFFEAGPEVEPTYQVIEGGGWGEDSPYGVVHRLAGDGSVPGLGLAAVRPPAGGHPPGQLGGAANAGPAGLCLPGHHPCAPGPGPPAGL